ncbi:ATP-binding protein [Dulcicalothrix desertica]|uniref:PAS domain-containing sensor histidine kinase n=1 Tax=Dulcicalothrix desertica TaxID=32056 RepID=UPI002278CD95|nr:ATP-binding protein [Dulcicalothrix desertica]
MTALKLAEQSLQESEYRFQQLFEQAADPILLLDAKGFVDCNQAAINLFGFSSKGQLCSLHLAQVSPQFQPDGQMSLHKINKAVEQAVDKGSYKYEWIFQRQGDQNFWTEVTLTLIPYKQESILHCVVRDISERKATQMAIEQKSQELEQALQDLQQAQLQIIQNEKMSALGNLVAGVAHEINNPIGFIAASLEQVKPVMADITEHLKLYQNSLPNPDQQILKHAQEIDLDYALKDVPEIIDSMLIACERLKNISISLRTFSRADQDYKVPFNLSEGIDSTLLILKHRLKGNHKCPVIQVITEYGELPKVECYPGKLNQVFMNILANAIDALEESNSQESFGNGTKAKQIVVKTSVENNYAKISIADTGKGMSEEVKQKIFNHLFTTKAVGKGTGLGLAIARQIVEEKHGGEITVNSTPGRGSEFVITLPI